MTVRDGAVAVNTQEYGNRSSKVHSSHLPQAQGIQTMTQQIYSQ